MTSGDTNAVRHDHVVHRNENVVFRELEDEVVILSVETGKYYGLDEVGARVWSLIGDDRTVGELCQILVTEFDVTLDECTKDVIWLLSSMADEGLVRMGSMRRR